MNRLFRIARGALLILLLGTSVLLIRSFWYRDYLTLEICGWRIPGATRIFHFTTVRGAMTVETEARSLYGETSQGLSVQMIWDSSVQSGFNVYSGNMIRGATPAEIPFWFVLLLTGVIPGISVFKYFRHKRTLHQGLCPRCAYDLRATPKRCPECGFVPPIHQDASRARLAELLAQLPSGDIPGPPE